MKNSKRKSQISQQDLLDAAIKERELRRLLAERARRTMAGFVTFTHPDYFQSEFSKTVCDELDRFLDELRQGLRPVLILQAPPQHGKSELVSRRFPAYAFGRYPDLRIGACSYSADLAQDMNRDVQRIMMDDLYKSIFPDSYLNPKRVVTLEGQAVRNSGAFDIVGHRGRYVCTGVGGPLTGKSLDLGIIDDPIKNEQEARSPAIKKAIHGWYNTVFLTRLSKNSGHIIMATSWATDDLAATVVKNNPRARHLKFKAISDGAALIPELHPLYQLSEIKESMSSAQWSALYQQNPVPEGGAIFKEEWIRRWTVETLPSYFDELILSWDMTFKDTSGTDFVVGEVWARAGVQYYLLHLVRGRMAFVKSREAVIAMNTMYPNNNGVLIEDKANGPAIIDSLREVIAGLVPVEPDGSKMSRAYAVSSLWEAGNVFIPEDSHALWVKDFVEELVSFPAGGHDDQVDAMTQALRRLKSHGLATWQALAD